MSTYYSDPKVSRAEREEREADVRGKIEQIRVELPRTGYRMLLNHLKRQGVVIGERKLRQILCKFDLGIKPKRRFVRTTDSNHSHRVHPNLLEELTIDNINQVWTADLTYIRIENGFVYRERFMNRLGQWAVEPVTMRSASRSMSSAVLASGICSKIVFNT